MPLHLAQLYRLGSMIAPRVPARLGYALCDLVGSSSGAWLPAYRHICANLRVVMPDATDAERDRTARRVISGISQNYFDLLRFPALSSDEVARTVSLSGRVNVERVLDRGRGTLMIAPHCGNYTVGFAPLIAQLNTRLLLVVEQMADPQVHAIINRIRQHAGIDVAPLSPTISRTILKALRQNHIVVLAGDRAIAANAIDVRFFGRPTPIPSGPATLALRTGVPILPGFVTRMPDHSTHVHVDPMITIETSGDRERDIRDVTQKIAYIMQAYIRRDPSQWMVAEPVWPNA